VGARLKVDPQAPLECPRCHITHNVELSSPHLRQALG
jgi:hypothetical protein